MSLRNIPEKPVDLDTFMPLPLPPEEEVKEEAAKETKKEKTVRKSSEKSTEDEPAQMDIKEESNPPAPSFEKPAKADKSSAKSLKEELLEREAKRKEREERERALRPKRSRTYQRRHIEIPETSFCSEKEISFKDADAEAMYNLLKISSADIGFSWPTEMLMNRVITIIDEAGNNEEIEGGILSIRNGNKIWDVLKDKLDEGKAIAKNSK